MLSLIIDSLLTQDLPSQTSKELPLKGHLMDGFKAGIHWIDY